MPTQTYPAVQENDGLRNQFGAFGGVFTPSILTILGVIMFMRAGYVIGEGGIRSAFVILLIANSITFLTGLSICATATNTPIRGGGAYFMISRVLGPEFGGAIGLALFFGQALSVPFYIIGFVESLTATFPNLQPYTFLITLSTALILFVTVYLGASWAIRVQYLILAILVGAIVVYLGGAVAHFKWTTLQTNMAPARDGQFWMLFAVYFPAVTGIMAGVNMSGDLKDPSRSIPRGTLAAIAAGFMVYGLQIFLCGGAQARADLVERPFQTLLGQSFFQPLVVAGVFAATISSAMGSFMGAPRVMQALARDQILTPLKLFAKGSAKGDEPRRALTFTFLITVAVIVYADSSEGGNALNMVAGVVTMFFLYTYGMTNLAAFVESFGLNPSFRPRFRYFHWLTALAGAVGCGTAAFLVHAPAAIVALVLVGGLYLYIRSRVLETAFGDARRGFVYSRLRSNLYALAKLPPHPKNWRPNVLALTGNPESRTVLARFANWVGGGRGIVTLAQILPGSFENRMQLRTGQLKRLQAFIQDNNLNAFPEVITATDFDEGLATLIQAHSIGPMKPNLVMFGWPTDPARAEPFTRHLRAARDMGMSLMVVRDKGLPPPGRVSRIDIWWRGMHNGGLLLLTAHLLQLNWAWAHSRIRVLRLVRNEPGREPATQALNQLIHDARIEADVEVIISDRPFSDVLRTHSANAAVVMLGFQVPEDPGTLAFSAPYVNMLEELPTTLLVSSCGDADLLA